MSNDFIKAGVIGHPIGHSLSPHIHGYWLEKYGLQGSYKALEIRPAHLKETLEHFIEQGYRGFNVTLPHKQAIMALCDEIDEAAQKIGAVNTLSFDNAGRMVGSNTDTIGFYESVKEALPAFDFGAGSALVLGAGGAARAVIHSLQQAGAPEIIIANRSFDKAQALAKEFGVKSVDWEERENVAAGVNFMVNTTSLGMTGQPELEFDVKALPSGVTMCDIVYNPRRTKLLQDAAANGHDVVEGLGMLLHQARPAFKKFYGIMPEVTDELRAKLYKILGS